MGVLTAAERREPRLSLRRGGGRQHPAGERGGAVERVERLCIVARAGILVGQQERERERVGPAGRRAGRGSGCPVDQRLSAERDRARGGEVGREVAAGDLAGRPPQRARARPARAWRRRRGSRLSRARRARARRYSGAPPVSSSPAQHGTERLRGGAQAEIGGDRLGRRIGLLGREAALLDRERGRVTGGVHAARARSRDRGASTGMKPWSSPGRPSIHGPSSAGSAIAASGGDGPAPGEPSGAVGVRLHAAVRERRSRVRAAARPVSADAAPPNSWSGAASGDTTRIATWSAPRSRSSTAVMIASS